IAGCRQTNATVDHIARAKDNIAAQVVDTESAGWARAASKFRVPFAVVRAIFDPADEQIPDFVTTNRAAVVRHALTHPGAIPILMQMRERVRRCAEALADFVIASAIAPETRLDALLRAPRRTFALCLPLLPDPTRPPVTIAYLLFRIADAFEDASHWPVADRLAALDEFCSLLRTTDSSEAQRLAGQWCAKGPSPHAGYTRLIADIPLVIDAF